MGMKRTILLLTILLAAAAAWGQDDVEADSVLVSGAVVNRMSGRPEPYSVVRLLQQGALRASASCDSTGAFAAMLVPEGSYLLEVQVRGITLYQSDLVLMQNVDLSIGVITDTLRMVNLREVRVTALRHLLGSQYIFSPDDTRLWNMHRRHGGGDHSAAVAISPDMVPEWDELDAQGGVVRALLPLGVPRGAYKYHLRNAGLKADATNSDMKNDLILNGRIRDAKATPKKQEKN